MRDKYWVGDGSCEGQLFDAQRIGMASMEKL